jgi:hypothetical protein
MNSSFRQIELTPKTQTDIGRKFKLKALRWEACKAKLCLYIGRLKLSSTVRKIKLLSA